MAFETKYWKSGVNFTRYRLVLPSCLILRQIETFLNDSERKNAET